MKLESKDFKQNELMDKKFSYRGGNKSPHLKWSDAPNGIKSFAISCNDPDAPVGDWIHWYVVNIPSTVKEIAQGGPVPGVELETDFGQKGYGGPSPPSGTHRYVFRVYALKVDKLEGVNKKNFKEKVKQSALATAELIGLYKK